MMIQWYEQILIIQQPLTMTGHNEMVTQWQDDNKNLKSVCVLLVEDVVKELDVVEEEEHLVLAHLLVDSDHRVGDDIDVDSEDDFVLASTTTTKTQTTTTTLQVWQCCWLSNVGPQWQKKQQQDTEIVVDQVTLIELAWVNLSQERLLEEGDGNLTTIIMMRIVSTRMK